MYFDREAATLQRSIAGGDSSSFQKLDDYLPNYLKQKAADSTKRP
jgi:hypothetical protein